MINKTALIFFLSFIICAVFILPKIVLANDWTFTDNFEAYNLGDLNGQGSWAGDTNSQVVNTPCFAGSRCVSGTADDITQTFTTGLTYGSFSIEMRASALTGGSRLLLTDVSDAVVAEISFATDGFIKIYNGDTNGYDVIQAYAIDTYYTIEFAFELTAGGYASLANNYYKVRIDEGDWTSDTLVESTNDIKKLRMYRSSGDIHYFDNISPTTISVEEEETIVSSSSDLYVTDELSYILIFFFAITIFITGFVIVIKI